MGQTRTNHSGRRLWRWLRLPLLFEVLSGRHFACLEPTTNILKYVDRAVALYEKLAFGSEDFRTKGLPVATNVLGPELRSHHIFYLQNAPDGHHVRNQLIPFLSTHGFDGELTVGEMKRVTETLTVYLGDWGRRHAPPSKDMLKGILGDLVREELEWTASPERKMGWLPFDQSA